MAKIVEQIYRIMSKEEITIDELKIAMLQFGVFGEVEVEIRKTEEDTSILLIDKDICEYEINGEIIVEDMSTKLLVLCLDNENIVGFIEHNFGAVTKANVNSIRHMCNFIDKKIIL